MPNLASLYEAAWIASANYARRLVGPAWAEDVAQEVFLRLMRYPRQNASELTLSLVLAVTRNVALSLRKRDGHRAKQLATRLAEGDARRSLGDRAPSQPDADPRHHEAIGGETLQALTEAQYEALVMTEVRGLSEIQAGVAMAVSRSAVHARRRHAIEALRRRVDELRSDPAPSAVAPNITTNISNHVAPHAARASA